MTVFIDAAFFAFPEPEASGLISGLALLQSRGFTLATAEGGLTEQAAKLLKLEGIEVQTTASADEADYIITLSEMPGGAGKTYFVASGDGPATIGEAANELVKTLRFAERKRKTKETKIKIAVQLDGSGISDVDTGIGFFDHMLDQIARHGNIDLTVRVEGDLHVDEHHTVEDTGIAFGEAVNEALGDRKGITRYGFLLPMDDSVARVGLDLGGRSYLNFKCRFQREKVGEFPTELVEEFFRGVASGMKANLYMRAKGKNDHHKIEALFKAFAKSLNDACRFDERTGGRLPTTKGLL